MPRSQIRMIAGRSPMPKNMIASGISAMPGKHRKIWIVAGIIVIGFFGLGFDQLIRLMRSYFCRWQEGLVLEA